MRCLNGSHLALKHQVDKVAFWKTDMRRSSPLAKRKEEP
jgi:hypothetical protein